MSDAPTFSEGIVTDSKTSTSSSSSSGPSIPEVSEGVANLVIEAMKQNDGFVELRAFDSDAPDLPDEHKEYFGLEDTEKFSVESLFGYDWDQYDYIGTPPVMKSENLTDEQKEQYEGDELYKSNGDEIKYVVKPEYLEALRGAKVLKGGVTPINKALNGYHADLITEAFGDDVKLSVGKGKSRNHGGDDLEAMTYVAFWVSDSDTAPIKREKARMEAGQISEEDFKAFKEQHESE